MKYDASLLLPNKETSNLLFDYLGSKSIYLHGLLNA